MSFHLSVRLPRANGKHYDFLLFSFVVVIVVVYIQLLRTDCVGIYSFVEPLNSLCKYVGTRYMRQASESKENVFGIFRRRWLFAMMLHQVVWQWKTFSKIPNARTLNMCMRSPPDLACRLVFLILSLSLAYFWQDLENRINLSGTSNAGMRLRWNFFAKIYYQQNC